MSLRLGMAVEAAEIHRLLEQARSLQEARDLVDRRREQLAALGGRRACQKAVDAVYREVVKILREADWDDSFEHDTLPALRVAISHAMGYRAPGEEELG